METTSTKQYKVTFTDGTGDSIPMIPASLGKETHFGCDGDGYHYFAIVETRAIDDVVSWYNNQFNDVSEGVLSVSMIQ